MKVNELVIWNESWGVKCGTVCTIKEIDGDNIILETPVLTPYTHDGNGLCKPGFAIYCDKSCFSTLVPELTEEIPELKSPQKAWTSEDIDTLHCYYRRKSVKELAEQMGRTEYSIQSKARNERIHKHPRREFNVADCHKIRHDNLDSVSEHKTAKELHRSVEVLQSRKSLMQSRNEL